MHLVRNSLSYRNGNQRQPVDPELKHVLREKAEFTAKRLEELIEGPWAKPGCRYPELASTASRLFSLFVYTMEIRKIIQLPNAIKRLDV